MRYAIYPINPNKSYGITIGIRLKPDSELRELIRSQIDTAMGALERAEYQTHRVAILLDWDSAESGLPEAPLSLDSWRQYLIFALLYSSDPGSAESLSSGEIEFYREELGLMLEGILGKTRAALVLLRDCSVSVIEADNDTSSPESAWVAPRDIFPDSPWNSDRDTPEKRWG